MTSNQLAENSVIQLLNSVKLARDNAERADNRVDHSFYYALTIALEELQERRKADSEPVAWLLSGGGTKNVVCFDSGNAYADPLREVTPLYRHAQPAPVVPDELNTRTANDVMNEHLSWKDYGDAEVFCIAWNACRAAMLNGGKS